MNKMKSWLNSKPSNSTVLAGLAMFSLPFALVAGYMAWNWQVKYVVPPTPPADIPATPPITPPVEVSSKVETPPVTLREKTLQEKWTEWQDGGDVLMVALADSMMAVADSSTHSQLVRNCNDMAEAAYVMDSYYDLPVPEAERAFASSMNHIVQGGKKCAAASSWTEGVMAMERDVTTGSMELENAKAILRAEGLDA